MTLIFDNRANLQGKPGLHALVAGVSAYPHLPGGIGAPAPDSFGMQQLSSTALTAYKMYCWLQEWQDRLRVPLATCRLILSPSPTELEVESKLRDLADRCTQNNFRTAANEWREDSRKHKENVTLFYFAGHGVQRNKSDQVLLMEDFGDGIGGTLDKSVNTNNLFYGMTPTATYLNTALTQLYFIDACRVLPSRFKNFEQMSVPDVFNVELSGADQRHAPVFYAAVPGSKAYAVKGEQTLFSKALLACLTGGAGELRELEDGQERWCVSLLSLSEKLGEYIRIQNQESDSEQDFRVDGIGTKDVIIHYLDKPPLVDIVFEVDPLEALPFTRVEVLDDAGQPIPGLPMPLDPHPYHYSLPAGYYSISARIQPPQPPFVDRPGRTRPVEPPGRKWPVRVLI
jgi:Caspase domain